MKIYTMDECIQWVDYKQVYHQVGRQLFFTPKYKDENGVEFEASTDLVLDCNGKVFGHDVQRIKDGVSKLCENYPHLESIITGDFPVFLAPKIHAGGANGYANQHVICLWGKPTQIPPFMTDYIIGHEFGHVVQFTHFDRHGREDRVSLMKEYLTLRNAPKGICHIYVDYDEKNDKEVYEDREEFLWLEGSSEDKRPEWNMSPYEWFAEDFRYLFCIDKEKFWLHPISPPDNTVREFIMRLGEKSSVKEM